MPKIPGGYYIKARQIKNSAIATAPPYVREIWDWLIREANHADAEYKGYSVKRGQLFRTYKDIREGLAWYVGWRKMMYNENHTKKAMKFLREAHMIATTKALGGVLITIINYDHFQEQSNYSNYHESTTESTTEGTIAEPSQNHPIPDSNNQKNNDNRNNGYMDTLILNGKEIQVTVFWDNMLELLQSAVSEANYRTYLEGTYGFGVQGDVFAIGVSSESKGLIIKRQLGGHIENQLSNEIGREIKLKCEVKYANI